VDRRRHRAGPRLRACPSSYEERGVIRIAQAEGGWAASSSLVTRSTPAHPWPVVKDLIDTFVRDTHELTARCLVEVGWPRIEVSAALHDAFGLPLADAKTLVRRASDRRRELGTPRDQAGAASTPLAAGGDLSEIWHW
jgi:hypothetical protein